MVVIRSLKRTLPVLQAHPIVFVGVFAFALVQTIGQLPQFFMQSTDPLASTAVSLAISGVFVFVYPFFQGGLIGMANDAVTDERTTLGRFLAHGREHYVSLLGAYLVVTAIALAFGALIGVVVFFGLLGFVATEGSALATVGIALVMLAVFLLYLAVFTAVHFYGHAIVLEDSRAIESLKRSVDVVRNNLRSVLGYLVVLVAGGVVLGAVYVGLFAWLAPTPAAGQVAATPDLGTAAIALGGSTLLMTVFGAVYLIFSVVFYRSIVGLDAPGGAGGASGTTGTSGASSERVAS